MLFLVFGFWFPDGIFCFYFFFLLSKVVCANVLTHLSDSFPAIQTYLVLEIPTPILPLTPIPDLTFFSEPSSYPRRSLSLHTLNRTTSNTSTTQTLTEFVADPNSDSIYPIYTSFPTSIQTRIATRPPAPNPFPTDAGFSPRPPSLFTRQTVLPPRPDRGRL